MITNGNQQPGTVLADCYKILTSLPQKFVTGVVQTCDISKASYYRVARGQRPMPPGQVVSQVFHDIFREASAIKDRLTG